MKHALPLPTDLIPLAEGQGGAFSRQQFLALGGHQRQIDRALRNDSWIRLGQGIYSLQRSPTFETYCWGGLLLSGTDAGSIGGLAAAHLRGVVSKPPSSITVWGPDLTRTVGPWRFRRGSRPRQGSLPTLPPDESILDACSEATPDEVLDLLAGALRERITTASRLHAMVKANERQPHRRMLLELLPDLAEGVESGLEHGYLRRVERAHRLPEGVRQASISDGTRSDVLYDEYQLLVELDGTLGHIGNGAFRDAERDNRHLLAGYWTLRFGWRDVVVDPCKVARIVDAVLRQRGWQGPSRRRVSRARRCPRC